MKSVLLKIRNKNNSLLPYEHNYDLSIAIYHKLRYYQNTVRELHKKGVQDVHTISSIIPNKPEYQKDGIRFEKGIFVIRSYYDDLLDHLRLAISLDGTIKIGGLETEITQIKDTVRPDFRNGRTNFRTLSPVLVRDHYDRNTFRTHRDDVPDNLAMSMAWSFSSFTATDVEIPVVNITNVKRKTVRVSNNGTTLGAVLLNGSMEGDTDLLQFSYYKGLGSKTGLGLGCWEVT